MSSVKSMVHQHVRANPEASPHEVSEALAGELTEAQQTECIRGYLNFLAGAHRQEQTNLLVQQYAPVDKSTVRADSSAGHTTSRATTFPGEQGSDFLAKRRSLFSRQIWVPSLNSTVAFGQMTTAHHHSVVDHLAGTIAGINERIAGHHRAIDQIEESGVTCLDEVPNVVEDEFASVA